MELKDFMKKFDPSGEYTKGFLNNFEYVEGVKIIKISNYGDHENYRADVVASLKSLKADLSLVYKNFIDTHYTLLNLE